MQKSCGNADELEAKAMMRGAEGKAFRDEILSKYGELNPVVMKAQKFLESLFATYDELGRKNHPINGIKAISILIKNQLSFLNLKV